MLVVQRQSLALQQFAGASSLLGVAPDRLAHFALSDLFKAPMLKRLTQCLRQPLAEPALLHSVSSRHGAVTLNITVHVQDELGIIEVEAAGPSGATVDALSPVRDMLLKLRAAESLAACCQAAATQVRLTTGYDRVMVYQFLLDGSGQVVAEDKAERLPPFLGLHYPASDIPQQARALYLRNWLRLVPDVNYSPAPLQATALGGSQEPLDMSQCILRSVSPIHLEYLRNMGVGATLTLSIVIDGQLWGLIACHHEAVRHLPAGLRSACELISQIFSMQLQARLALDTAQRRMVPANLQQMLARSVLPDGDVASELVRRDAPLLELIEAGGAAVYLDGKFSLIGQTPPPEFLAELVQWLHVQHRPVIDTYALGADFAPARPFADIASGLLAVSLSRVKPDYVLWFRPEVVRTVNWAGDPSKPVEPGPYGNRLSPRKSFAAWEESVHQQSARWDEVDLSAAHAFRLWMLETVLRQMELARSARDTAFSQQNMLMAELDHRVKNTLANVQAVVQHTKAGASTVDDFAQGLERRIGAMAHAHLLLANSRWQGASVRSLVEEELAPFRAASNARVTGEEMQLSPSAALAFNLVVHELVCNAVKYGALSTPNGCVHIDWRRQDDGSMAFFWKERGGPPVSTPTRKGFGSVVIGRSLRHELQGDSSLRFESDGVACALNIPAAHVLAPPVNRKSTNV